MAGCGDEVAPQDEVSTDVGATSDSAALDSATSDSAAPDSATSDSAAPDDAPVSDSGAELDAGEVKEDALVFCPGLDGEYCEAPGVAREGFVCCWGTSC